MVNLHNSSRAAKQQQPIESQLYVWCCVCVEINSQIGDYFSRTVARNRFIASFVLECHSWSYCCWHILKVDILFSATLTHTLYISFDDCFEIVFNEDSVSKFASVRALSLTRKSQVTHMCAQIQFALVYF